MCTTHPPPPNTYYVFGKQNLFRGRTVQHLKGLRCAPWTDNANICQVIVVSDISQTFNFSSYFLSCKLFRNDMTSLQRTATQVVKQVEVISFLPIKEVLVCTWCVCRFGLSAHIVCEDFGLNAHSLGYSILKCCSLPFNTVLRPWQLGVIDSFSLTVCTMYI